MLKIKGVSVLAYIVYVIKVMPSFSPIYFLRNIRVISVKKRDIQPFDFPGPL